MNIVSDFDGVWTDPSAEAGAMADVIAEELRRLAPRANGLLEDLVRRIRVSPERHGWVVDGRISSYADEDPFCANNALCAALYEGEWAASLRPEFADASAFASHCYHAAVERVERQAGPQMLPGARAAVERILKSGARLVILSNSSPAKLLQWFRSAGVDVSENSDAPVRVRGNAGKFRLGGTGEKSFSGRIVQLGREPYRRALLEERPDAVIGDNLSLDLSLPSHLKSTHPDFRSLRLVLARTPYTPEWSRRSFREAGGSAEVRGLAEFASWVEREMTLVKER